MSWWRRKSVLTAGEADIARAIEQLSPEHQAALQRHCESLDRENAAKRRRVRARIMLALFAAILLGGLLARILR